MLGIEPDGLGIERVLLAEIDHGVGAIDALQGEGRGQLRKGEEFAVVLGDQPSRQRKLTNAWGRKPASR